MRWDLESGKKTSDFCGHNGDIVSISLHPEGNMYLTGSVDRTIKLWDLREETPKQQFVGHEADVNSVCVSNNDLIH
jgi:guanine nucleotide-binding protein subunit beta, other